MMNTDTDYALLLAQCKAITGDESDSLANTSNISSLLFHSLPDVNWAGIYLLRNGALVLGPFQGKSACVRINIGAGVCGTAVAENRVLRIDDVHAFEGHIACDANSESEIVLPLTHAGVILGVLDIDSPRKGRFSSIDQAGLLPIAALLSQCIAASPQSLGLDINP